MIFTIFAFFPAHPAIAESTYVLPYPSVMPGNFFYKIHILEEKLQSLWHFGSFGKFSYNLKLADKYLVEAKTLFEYKQYLLATKALSKSNYYFSQIPKTLSDAISEKKIIIEKQDLFKRAAEKHIEVLTSLGKTLPSVFLWQPEDGTNETLLLQKQIDQSLELRKKVL